MAELTKVGTEKHPSQETELHTEQLAGRSWEVSFSPEEEENFYYPGAFSVDLNKRGEIDAAPLTTHEINLKIRELMAAGHGTIVVQNPMGKHSLGVGDPQPPAAPIRRQLGILCLRLDRWSQRAYQWPGGVVLRENMMAGTVVIEKNAGSSFGAALRGGDLVCKGDVGGRTGIDMKGGTILVGERTGPFSGFMMQRGRLVVLGDAGKNLGDSMYDGTIYVGGKITSLGVDAVPGELTELD